MECNSLEFTLKSIREYLDSMEKNVPFFIAFSSYNDYCAIKEKLSACDFVRVSDCCTGDDVLPDEDCLRRMLRTPNRHFLLLGVGEFATLREEGRDFLQSLFGLQLPNSKVIVPLWNGHAFLEEKRNSDTRLHGNQVVCLPSSPCPLHFHWFRNEIPLKADFVGFKHFLRFLEDGLHEEVRVQTQILLGDTWGTEICTAFEVYRALHPDTRVPVNMFSEDLWSQFLDDKRSPDDSLESADTLLQLWETPPQDPYLRFVREKTHSFSEYSRNLTHAILEVPVEDAQFSVLYDARKKLLREKKLDVSAYVVDTLRFDGAKRLSYLTDNTLEERIAMISQIVKLQSIPSEIRAGFPILASYLQHFTITNPQDEELGKLLTDYFEDYKRQKLRNHLEPTFEECVRQIAKERPHLGLPERGAVLEKLRGDQTYLYWMDALGCEFLGLIQALAEEEGLKLRVHVARAALPSITSVNRMFYDEWHGCGKTCNQKLDKLKHGDFEDFGYDRSEVPIQLDFELRAIQEMFLEIVRILKTGRAQKVLLTSDHGATRLAILSERETLWELPEKGKHGGRCCRKRDFQGTLPPCVTESDDDHWLVLANYDRFKGGRKSDVEVHGGATLEEMVVPVIELELRDSRLKVELLTKEFSVTFKHDFVDLILFYATTGSNLSVEFEGKRHCVMPDGEKRFKVRLSKPRAGEHVLPVFDGDTRIAEVRFTVQRGGVNIQKDEDFF